MESGSPEIEVWFPPLPIIHLARSHSLQVAIGRSPPWLHSSSSSSGTFTSERKISPIHNIGGVTTAILILHSEKDERVPLGQARGFYRGLKRCAAPQGREAIELVVYPREPHGFVERRHVQDVFVRVLVYFNRYIWGVLFNWTQQLIRSLTKEIR